MHSVCNKNMKYSTYFKNLAKARSKLQTVHDRENVLILLLVLNITTTEYCPLIAQKLHLRDTPPQIYVTNS